MREDFFYRVNVVPIAIPPLRDRLEDIPLLATELLKNNAMAKERGGMRLANRALQALMGYHWPGNVRELGNVIERSVLKTAGPVIKDVELPSSSALPVPAGSTAGASGAPARNRDFELPLKEFLKREEKEYLAAILRRAGGGIAATSEHAMVDAATLHRKMKQHGLKRSDFRRPRPSAKVQDQVG